LKQFKNIKSEKMVFRKALWHVVLLLSATIFGENQRLENDSNLEKRAQNLPRGTE
jgi:hypothetical protein